MLSGAPSAFAPVPLPLGGTPAILDLQNLLTATSLLLGHQALPVVPEHTPAGLQALPRPRFIPCTTDPHPGVPRAFRGLCGPSEGVRGWSASGDCGMQRGRGANSMGGRAGWRAMPRGDGLSLLSCDGQEMALGADMEGLATTPQTRAPTRGCSQSWRNGFTGNLRGFYFKVICSVYYRALLIRHWQSCVVYFSSS